ncbi:MAG: hypothetical protein MJE77_29730, partial [Proteobacteria bacterium]|nr:hypothetical protein [Pseudomonadota bacterium]
MFPTLRCPHTHSPQAIQSVRQDSGHSRIWRAGAGQPAAHRPVHLDCRSADPQALPTSAQSDPSIRLGRRDAYGRFLPGNTLATIEITYQYPLAYYAAQSDFARSFAQFGRSSGGRVQIIGQRQRVQPVGLRRTYRRMMHASPGPHHGLGAWTPSIYHRYQPSAGALWLGNGAMRRGVKVLFSRIIETVAGTGQPNHGGDGGPARAARVTPTSIAVAPDGSLYIATAHHRIRRVDLDGLITTVAGTGESGHGGDGGPATEAQLSSPEQIAFGPDGDLYIAERDNHRIRRVRPDGIITTVAGTGTQGHSGDGGPAIAARLSSPRGLAVDSAGILYVTSAHRIRRIDADGTIMTIAGKGGSGRFSGDGGPARDALLSFPRSLDVGPDGALYIADSANQRIRRIDTGGTITTVAGTGQFGHSGDGEPAIRAGLANPVGIAVGPAGDLIIASYSSDTIRRVDPKGVITTIAGVGRSGFSGDGGPAARARVSNPLGSAIGPDGSVYVADYSNARVRRIRPLLPDPSDGEVRIAATNGASFYIFDRRGRHLRTVDAHTMAALYTFAHDESGRLTTITDADGDVVTIERHPDTGQPTAIVSAYGQRTALDLDGNGYLETVTSPAGDTIRIEYDTDGSGLMTAFVDPNQHRTTFAYDELGRLHTDSDPAGGGWTLTRSESDTGYTVTMTSTEGRASTYEVTTLPTGDRRLLVRAADGTETTRITHNDGTSVHTSADGSTATRVQIPDPRLGMQAPLLASQTVVLPSGLTTTTQTSRSVELNHNGALIRQTDQLHVNGRILTTVYDATTRTTTVTTPQGRTITATSDQVGRPLHLAIPGLAPSAYHYDRRGRVETLIRGTAPNTRTTSLAYEATGLARGFLHSITDPLQDTLTFTYDLRNHTVETRGPHEELIGHPVRTEYDSAGNLIAVTPPGQPTHRFAYTDVDLAKHYAPPEVPGVAQPATHYTYNRDRQVESPSRTATSSTRSICPTAASTQSTASPSPPTTLKIAASPTVILTSHTRRAASDTPACIPPP